MEAPLWDHTGGQNMLWNHDICVLLFSYTILQVSSNWEKEVGDRQILVKNKILKKRNLKGRDGTQSRAITSS